MRTLPSGTVTYLMTDIVGSTRLWENHPAAMVEALPRHDALASEFVARHGGHVVKNRGEGDSLFVVFDNARSAVVAAQDLQTAFRNERWPGNIDLQVRIAVHTGESMVRDSDYYGPSVNRCARLRAIAQGGQVLLTEATSRLINDEDVQLRDLGKHRLRDLLRPERVSEIVLANAPEARLHSLDEHRHNLPVQLTSFIGREDDILRVRSLTQSARLVTLVGAGGSGKTRLSLQVAADSGPEFRNGLWFIDLSSLKPGDDLFGFAARSVGVNPTREVLVRTLQGERTLLIVDNCEHLVEDAADFVFDLLKSCPELVVIATSREALQLPGEVRSPVPPMSLPPEDASLDEVESSEAGRLFLERAILRKPVFQLSDENCADVGNLCRLLDGIPLAIEQAASNIAFLAPGQLLVRFRKSLRQLGSSDRSLSERHRSLYATMRWSYDMLSPDEREVFCRSALFVGGWTLEAVEAVCDSPDAAFALQRLLDKSLVVAEDHEQEIRYQMLQSIRDFALDCGDAAVETRERISRYFATEFKEGTISIARAAAEHQNLLQSLDWLFDHEAEVGTELAINLRQYFMATEQFESGYRVMERALQHATLPRQKATVLNVMGAIEFRRNRYSLARPFFRQSLDAWEAIGDQEQLAMVSHNLGLLLAADQDREGAMPVLEESARRYRELGNHIKAAACDLSIARVQLEARNFASSAQLFESALAAIADSDPVRVAVGLANLAMAQLQLRDLGRSLESLEAAYTLLRGTGDVIGLALALAVTTILMHELGHPAQASRILGQLRNFQHYSGAPVNPFEQEIIEQSGVRALDLSKEMMNQDQILSYAFSCCSESLADVRLQ